MLITGLLAGCATASAPGSEAPAGPRPGRAPEQVGSDEAPGDPATWLVTAEDALQNDQPARAAALFARYLGEHPDDDGARIAYPGLARAHEQLGDFEAAIRAYDGFVARFPGDASAPSMVARRGACEAEIDHWERSAISFGQVLELGGDALIPSQRVEALTRQGFALFHLDRLDEADALFAQADAIYEAATDSGEERFADTYFVAMARFYRAAVLHRRFRAAPIRLPEAQMEKDFEAKLRLLEEAQAAYNQVIRARHIYWVSAAGLQLGSLFEEFYDAVMYAPVPDWLDEAQRRIYYAELEDQLRPVIEKAIWVFEKNLETARKFGYDSAFIEQTEERLAQLEAVMLGRTAVGEPVPRLTPIGPAGAGGASADGAASVHGGDDLDELPAVERKLFVPMPTTL